MRHCEQPQGVPRHASLLQRKCRATYPGAGPGAVELEVVVELHHIARFKLSHSVLLDKPFLTHDTVTEVNAVSNTADKHDVLVAYKICCTTLSPRHPILQR